jgi:periplasmic copper chaperone A
MAHEKGNAMNRSIFAFALLAALSACKGQESASAKPEAVSVTDAVVRLSPVEGRPSAAYFTIHGGKAPDRLTAVSSPKAATIELHENSMEGGMMSMKAITGVDVPASGEVIFKSGGNHGMVFGIDPAVKAGEAIPMRFTFQSGASVDAEAKTVAAGDDMPMDMHEGH